jgi:Kdo2-lipid IVA lauroyltransferase/acyltransferase
MPRAPNGTAPPASGLRPALIRAILAAGNLHRRVLGVFFAVAGPRVAYALTGVLGRWMYRLLTPIRLQSEAQCRAALGPELSAAEVARIAEQSFVHRVWNLADLPLAERLLHAGTYARYGGRIPEPHLGDLRAAQARGQPAILLSAYYGSFDLLPLLLGLNGLPVAALYRAHANAAFDAYRRRVRARGGCALVPVEAALVRLPQILEAGGTVALIADHPAERRGLPVRFLGLPTRALPTVGVLAVRHAADVVVSGIRRVGDAFRFEIFVVDVIKPTAWAQESDPVRYVTERYLRGLEQMIRADPAQYLWAYARWGTEIARQLTVDATARAKSD